MAQQDRPGVRLLDVFLQMGYYERWQEDLELVRDLGVGAVRYSVPQDRGMLGTQVARQDLAAAAIDDIMAAKKETPA